MAEGGGIRRMGGGGGAVFPVSCFCDGRPEATITGSQH